MESKNESIQLTRICITTTFPVGEKSIFFSKNPPGKISYSIVLVLYIDDQSKTAEKPGVLSFYYINDGPTIRWNAGDRTAGQWYSSLPVPSAKCECAPEDYEDVAISAISVEKPEPFQLSRNTLIKHLSNNSALSLRTKFETNVFMRVKIYQALA